MVHLSNEFASSPLHNKITELHKKIFESGEFIDLLNEEMFLEENGGYECLINVLHLYDDLAIIRHVWRLLSKMNPGKDHAHIIRERIKKFRYDFYHPLFSTTEAFDIVMGFINKGDSKKKLATYFINWCQRENFIFFKHLLTKYGYMLRGDDLIEIAQYEISLHCEISYFPRVYVIKKTLRMRDDIDMKKYFAMVVQSSDDKALEVMLAYSKVDPDDLVDPPFVTISSAKRALISEYKKNAPDVVKKMVEKHEHAMDEAKIFALAIFLCDGLLKIC